MADTKVVKSLAETLLDLWKPMVLVLALLVVSPLAVSYYRQYAASEIDMEMGESEEPEGMSWDLAISLWHPVAIGIGITVLIFLLGEIGVHQDYFFPPDPQGLPKVTNVGLLEMHVGSLRNLSFPNSTAPEGTVVPQVAGVVVTVAIANLYNDHKQLTQRMLVRPGTTFENPVDMNSALNAGDPLQSVNRPADPASNQFKNYLDAVLEIKKAALQLNDLKNKQT